MGFTAGIEAWRPFLRPGGVIAVSEITWLRPDPPEEIRRHWDAEYPEITTAPEKIAILERGGFDLLDYFVLPSTSWLDEYYEPTGKHAGVVPQGGLRPRSHRRGDAVAVLD